MSKAPHMTTNPQRKEERKKESKQRKRKPKPVVKIGFKIEVQAKSMLETIPKRKKKRNDD